MPLKTEHLQAPIAATAKYEIQDAIRFRGKGDQLVREGWAEIHGDEDQCLRIAAGK